MNREQMTNHMALQGCFAAYDGTYNLITPRGVVWVRLNAQASDTHIVEGINTAAWQRDECPWGEVSDGVFWKLVQRAQGLEWI